MKTKKIILGTLIALGIFTACDKAKEAILEEATPLTSTDLINEANIDSAVEDISNLVQDQFVVQGRLQSKTAAVIVPAKEVAALPNSILPSCATPTFALVDKTITRTLDFGTTGCPLNNGNTVTGKIIMTFENNFDLSAGATRTITYTLSNFKHNENLVEGTKTITIKRISTTQLATVHTVITHTLNTKITFKDNKLYTRKGTLTRELIEGESTPTDITDNVWAVTGNTNTTLPNGAIITNNITSALIVKGSCKAPYPVEGKVTTTKNNFEAIFDFGKGECDNLATITTKGVTVGFEIKKP